MMIKAICCRFSRSALLALLLLLASRAAAAPPAGYYLVWADEFNGASLDSTKWGHRSLGARRDAINTASAVSFNGSNLVITTYTTNGTHYTGMISTSGKFHLRRGYAEASVNFDGSPGMWSAYWAQSPTMGNYIGDAFTSGVEFDVCEHRKVDGGGANIDGIVQANIHWDGYGASHKSAGSGSIGSGLGTGYHLYGWEWTPSQYRVWIDGASKWTTLTALSGHSEFLILSSEVEDDIWAGSIPVGGYGDLTTSTTKMFIDYVRYYAPTTSVFWDGSASASWTNTNNWVAGLSPKTTDEVTFSYLSKANRATTLGQDFSIKSLTFLETGGAVTISNNTLTLGSGGLDMISADNDPTIYSRLVLGAAQSWKIAESRTLNVSGELAGSGNLTKGNLGTLRLTASNSFTGTLTLNDGLVSLGNVNALQNTSGITMADGTALQSTISGVTVAAPITTAGTVKINAPNNNAGQVFSELILNGAIGGSSDVTFNSILNLNTIQTVTLGAQSTYSGNTLLDTSGGYNSQIIVKLGAHNALPPTTVVTIDGQNGNGSGRVAELNLFGFNQTLAGLNNITRSLRPQRVVNSDVAAPATLTISNSADYTYSGQLGGVAGFSVGTIAMPGSTSGNNFGLTKSGSGTFTLTGTNTYTGNTTVSNGTLTLSGQLTGAGTLAVAPGATLKGTGNNTGPLVVSGTLAPGASVGRFTSGTATWNSGGIYVWEISNPTNNSGWDLLSVSGALTIAATPTAKFWIKPTTLTAGGTPGLLAGFNNQSNYVWTLASANGGIAALDPNDFAVDTTSFSNALAGGAFTVEQSGNAVVLKFHANTFSPQFNSVAATVGDFVISANGVPGKAYSLQTATNLIAPVLWATITNATADVTGSIQFRQPMSASPHERYFRLTAP